MKFIRLLLLLTFVHFTSAFAEITDLDHSEVSNTNYKQHLNDTEHSERNSEKTIEEWEKQIVLSFFLNGEDLNTELLMHSYVKLHAISSNQSLKL